MKKQSSEHSDVIISQPLENVWEPFENEVESQFVIELQIEFQVLVKQFQNIICFLSFQSSNSGAKVLFVSTKIITHAFQPTSCHIASTVQYLSLIKL